MIKACEVGYEILTRGGSAIDAVEQAVVKLEDSPLFNAGTGGSPSITGEVELDAAIMTDDMKAGAVASIKSVKNPILVARKVMEKTDHIILCGEGAIKFARISGFPPYNPLTTKKKKMWENRLKKGNFPMYFPKVKNFINKYETVGACAMDKDGKMAAATSTGGIFMHLPGRIGDTPIIGAGTYACKYGAVSCTGHGEWIIKLGLAKFVCDEMKTKSAQKAIDIAIKMASEYDARCGIIGVDHKGNVGVGFNTKQMLWAYIEKGKLKSSQ